MDEHTLSEIITVLDGFALTLEEYAVDEGITLTRKAISHIRTELPSLNGKPIEDMVSLLVKSKCLSLMSLGVSWERLPYDGNSSPIICTINGQSFQGRASIHPKKVLVETETDGDKTSGSCVLHKWSPEVFTLEPFLGSAPNEKGLQCAKEIFLEICYKRMVKR